jgi:hypothetical protein
MNLRISTHISRYFSFKSIFILICIIALLVPVSAEVLTASQFGAASNPTGNPIGGGKGYSDIKTSGDYTVTTAAQLSAALASATPGQVIYIPETANIDLTGIYGTATRIPARVTLASNRGYNGSAGGRIFQNRLPGDPTSDQASSMLYINGNNVRITGLRIEGPDKTSAAVSPGKAGIFVLNYGGLVIDNCEISGWVRAIRVDCTNSTLRAEGLLTPEIGSSIANIHHNYIHHNQADGLGYGTILVNGSVLLKGNVYAHNRHSVATTGYAGQGYEASYNIVVENNAANDAVFDSHGKPASGDTSGTLFRIHHNTIRGNVVDAAEIMGTPTDSATFSYNDFKTCAVDCWGGGGTIVQYGSTRNLYSINNLIDGIFYPIDGGVNHYSP